MARRRPHHRSRKNRPPRRSRSGVRIVGGELRGRWIDFPPDPRTRPMKDRTREAVFNLVGKPDERVLVLDLFAGTGAMAIEALSRGAGEAICVEQYLPAAKRMEAAARELGLASRLNVQAQDVFAWWKRRQAEQSLPSDRPWWVFCCPPYALFHERCEQIDWLLETIWSEAPGESWLVVETDAGFDEARLPDAEWEIRPYPPAVVCLTLKEEPQPSKDSA